MIDFRHNYPILDDQAAMLARYLTRASGAELLPLPPWGGAGAELRIARTWLGAGPQQEVLACGGGNHALTVLTLALKLTGKAVVVDQFTYGAFIGVADMLGVRLLPCASDDDGMRPDALAALCRQHSVAALFLQPTVHNPTCVTMSFERRQQIAGLARTHAISIIEDEAYAFLHDSPGPRFMELLAAQTYHIYSLSKPFSPALKVAYLTVPAHARQALEQAIRLTSSGASSILLRVATGLVGDGVLDELIARKRVEAQRRQAVAREALAGMAWLSHPSAFHLWLSLPPRLSSADLKIDLLARGVDICSGDEFASPGMDGAHALRVALGAESDGARLRQGLHLIRQSVQHSMPALA